MNKSDLVKSLAKEMNLPMRKAEEIVDTVFGTMAAALEAGDRIEVRGFGSFVVKHYEGYTGRNPKTGELITVPGKRLPFFKTGKELREKINEGLSESRDGRQ
jgi:integration host factor subunit beta